MDNLKRLIPSLLVLFLLFAGCAGAGSSDVRKAVDEELGLLKKLDSDSVAKYAAGAGIVTDAEQTEANASTEIQDAFSLFYKDFNYKIQSVDIDQEQQTGTASVRITTLDARDLARDYRTALLSAKIQKASEDPGTEDDLSAAERYHLLYDLLLSNQYPTFQNTIELGLVKKGDAWEIERTQELEDALVGGLITYLSDPSLLSPSDTLDIYLRALKEMDADHLENYLEIGSITGSDDALRKEIADALMEQVRQYYDYRITDTSWKGDNAVVTAEITTFDSDAVLTAYQADMDGYMASADAVIDGAEKRTAIANEKLLAYISDNKASATSEADFEMENDGTGWRLIHPGEDLGLALFGSLVDQQ